VPGRGDGQELGEPLDNAEEDRGDGRIHGRRASPQRSILSSARGA